MVIGVELNDVLRNYRAHFLEVYNKFIDATYEPDEESRETFDLGQAFPFITDDEYRTFRYVDYAYELNARASECTPSLNTKFLKWTSTDLMDVDRDKVPELMVFSALEANLTIQATIAYLSTSLCRARTIYFPVDSTKIWDKCDIVITANPNILEAKPEGKISIKIEQEYNKEAEADYTFENMAAVIDDPERTIIKILEKDDEEEQ